MAATDRLLPALALEARDMGRDAALAHVTEGPLTVQESRRAASSLPSAVPRA